MRIDALNAEISTLSGRLEGGTQTIRAPFAGTYSAVADGYEAVLTPAALENMTVAQYDAIAPEAASSTVGRLIAGEEWRFVTVLSAADAARLQKGRPSPCAPRPAWTSILTSPSSASGVRRTAA